MQAYDIEVLGDARAHPHTQGWCFGLPPGIQPQQWPLDPNTGYPLMHGFTLLLPEDYRVHGPDVVALSFFSVAPDQNDGGPEVVPGIAEVLRDPSASAPADAELLPFWEAGRASHPRLHRMEDILGCAYAVILLSEAEFNGELCPPPALPAGNPLLARTPEPQWLSRGAAASFVPEWADESYYVVKALGGLPEVGHQQRYALTWVPREQDPNAGIIPSEDGSTGYQPFYYWENGKVDIEHYRQYDWAEFLKPNHIGGTLRPIQGIPDIGPFYIGFEEYLGGFNFGGGNAQLDFENMKFDWACG